MTPAVPAQRVIHVVLVGVMLSLCLALLSPECSFVLSPSYAYMRGIMSQYSWSAACGLVAAFGIVSMIVHSRMMRLASVVILTAGHISFAALIAVSYLHNIGTGLFAGYAVLGLYFVHLEAHEASR